MLKRLVLVGAAVAVALVVLSIIPSMMYDWYITDSTIMYVGTLYGTYVLIMLMIRDALPNNVVCDKHTTNVESLGEVEEILNQIVGIELRIEVRNEIKNYYRYGGNKKVFVENMIYMLEANMYRFHSEKKNLNTMNVKNELVSYRLRNK